MFHRRRPGKCSVGVYSVNGEIWLVFSRNHKELKRVVKDLGVRESEGVGSLAASWFLFRFQGIGVSIAKGATGYFLHVSSLGPGAAFPGTREQRVPTEARLNPFLEPNASIPLRWVLQPQGSASLKWPLVVTTGSRPIFQPMEESP